MVRASDWQDRRVVYLKADPVCCPKCGRSDIDTTPSCQREIQILACEAVIDNATSERDRLEDELDDLLRLANR